MIIDCVNLTSCIDGEEILIGWIGLKSVFDLTNLFSSDGLRILFLKKWYQIFEFWYVGIGKRWSICEYGSTILPSGLTWEQKYVLIK
jgi:hypothetical protein